MVYHGLPYGLPWFTMVQWQFQSRPSKKYVFFSWPDQCSGPHRQMCSKHFDKNMLHQFQNLRPKVGSEQMWRVGDANALSFAAFRHIISRFSLSLSIPEVSVSLVCSTSSRWDGVKKSLLLYPSVEYDMWDCLCVSIFGIWMNMVLMLAFKTLISVFLKHLLHLSTFNVLFSEDHRFQRRVEARSLVQHRSCCAVWGAPLSWPVYHSTVHLIL